MKFKANFYSLLNATLVSITSLIIIQSKIIIVKSGSLINLRLNLFFF